MDESMACSWLGNDKTSQQQELDPWQSLESEDTLGVQLLPINLPAEDWFVDTLQMVVSGMPATCCPLSDLHGLRAHC